MSIDLENNEKVLKERTAKGVFFSFLGLFFNQVINFVGTVLLGRLLAPFVFGIFGVLTYTVQQFPCLLYDLGLTPALVQKKGTIEKEDLSTVFTVQTATSTFFIILAFILAPFISRRYQLGVNGVLYLRIYSLILITFLLEGIPLSLLQRKINYEKIFWIGLTSTFSFNLIAVFLAFLKVGVWSLILGTTAGRVLGLFVLYLFSPPRFLLGINKNSLKKLLCFALPHKGMTITGLFILGIVPVLVGLYCGTEAVGYFNFGGRFLGFLSNIPLLVSQVLFSALSRSQENFSLFKKIVEKSIRLTCFIVFPLVAIIIGLTPYIIHFIFTDKWLPGIWVFYFQAFSALPGCVEAIVTNALVSLGKTKETFVISAIRAPVQWILAIFLIFTLGFSGAALGEFLTGFLFIPLSAILLNKQIKVSYLPNILPFLFSSISSGFILWAVAPRIIFNLPSLILTAFSGTLIYFLILYLILGKSIIEEGEKVKELIFANNQGAS